MVVKTRIVGACLWASRLMAATAAGFELGQRMRAVTKLVDRARQTSLWRLSKWGKQKLTKRTENMDPYLYCWMCAR